MLTAEEINSLPEPVRAYIMLLETQVDSAETIRSEVYLREEVVPQLEAKLAEAHARIAEIEAELEIVRVAGK
jgi:hypothetical protein